MMSPAGAVVLGGARIAGVPTAAVPRYTVSTNRGSVGDPYLALKTWMQCGAHPGVAAFAGTAARAPAAHRTPPIAPNVNLFFIDLPVVVHIPDPSGSEFREQHGFNRSSARTPLARPRAYPG